MSGLVEIALLGFLFFIAYLFIKYPDRAIGTSPRPDLKGPKGLPLIGNTLHEVMHRGERLECMLKEIEVYGQPSTITILGMGRIIHISKPEWLEHVQKTNFKNYVRGSLFNNLVRDVLGGGIFNADGDLWKVQRKSASHVFTVNNFKETIGAVLKEELKELREILEKRAESGEEFDLQNLYYRFTLSSFMKMAFSEDIGCLSRPEDPVPFAESFDYAQGVLDKRLPNPTWKITEKFSKQGKMMRESCKVIDDYAFGQIADRIKKLNGVAPEAKKRGAGKKDLLDLFMESRNEDGKPWSPQQLRDALLNFLIAGRDTTAQALSWMTWRLLSHPQELEKLRAEAKELLEADASVDFEELKSFRTAHAAFYETLRLHPSVPKNIKTALADDKLPDGPVIHKGDVVTYSDWAMGRNPAVWGDDAHLYKPDRWIDTNGEIKREGQWKFHAFNGGPRLCLGQGLATFEAVSVIVEVMRGYDVHMVNKDAPQYQSSLTLPMKGGFPVTITKRVAQE